MGRADEIGFESFDEALADVGFLHSKSVPWSLAVFLLAQASFAVPPERRR